LFFSRFIRLALKKGVASMPKITAIKAKLAGGEGENCQARTALKSLTGFCGDWGKYLVHPM
jgi:hypothetical protein